MGLVLASQDCRLFCIKRLSVKQKKKDQKFKSKSVRRKEIEWAKRLQVKKVFFHKNGKSLTASLVIGELLSEISFPIHAKRGWS